MIQGIHPGKLTCPLKMDGWKMKVPIEIVHFSGDEFVSFRGCTPWRFDVDVLDPA